MSLVEGELDLDVGTAPGRGASAVTPESADLVAFLGAQHAPLVALMSLYVADRELAEDLAQEALARACRDWNRVRSFDAPDQWLRRVAFNLANSHFRRRSAKQRAVARLKSRARSSDLGAPDRDAALAVRRAVAALPPPLRAVLVLRYFEDRPVSEVAAMLECPVGTVKSLTSRAIARLRASGLVNVEVPDE